ncbi:MAG: class I adenylate-forming enzyme family protein [Eubacteriales bacterium]|nr:class I adenylate-forming enzyme family protein [Eubacteriales bacterium]
MSDIISRIFNQKFDTSKIALRWEETHITYGELKQYIDSFSAYLLSKSIKKGDRIGLSLPNCAAFIIAYFAILNIGASVVLIDNKLQNEIIHIILECKLKIIITDDIEKERIIKIINASNEYNNIIPEFIIETQCTNIKIIDNNVNERFSSINPDQEAVILYTSGSSGKPKGVVNSHRTIVEALNNYVNTVCINENDIFMAVSPFIHSYAMGSIMLAGLASKSQLILQRSFQPRKTLKHIEEFKATIFHGVPYMYELLQPYIRDKQVFNSVRLLISAGAKLPKSISEYYQSIGKTIQQEYGSSESGTIAINLSSDKENLLSVGQPLKNVQVKISKDHNGLILVKSKGIALGYLDQSFVYQNGWYNTGDIGIIDENGYIYITGRKKNIVNIGGKKVNTNEICEVLLELSQVEAVIIKKYENKELGESIEAIIQTNSPDLCVEEIVKHCAKYLAAYKTPTKISFVNKLMRSSSGKTLSSC